MDQQLIIDVLKKWNIWEKDIKTGIPRQTYLEKIYPYLQRKEVIVLKGIRRSGKSTILQQLMHKLVKGKISKKQILYLNLEDYNFTNNLSLDLFDQVLTAYKEYTKNKKRAYLFIDEIQKIEGWEKWIRTLYDRNEDIKFIVTGSSASLLSKELSTLLTGRNLSFRIMPLSYEEFKQFKRSGTLEEYMHFGGFPEVVLEASKEKKLFILQQYFEDIITKDIINRYNIRNTKQIIELARYLVSTTGARVSTNKLSNVLGIAKDSIALYLSYMVDAYLLFEVTYFSFSAKTRHDVAKLPKYYALDNGLIHVVSVQYSKNAGQMYENTTLIKLAEEHQEIQYWSDAASEVDFIAGTMAINVTATDTINARETEGLENFCRQYKQFSPLLITLSTTKENMISLKRFLEQK